MKSRVFLIDPVKDQRWDKFVEDHDLGWLCHLAGWKLVLEKSFPHMKGYYLALLDDRQGHIEAALPLFQVKSWITGNKLVSIPYATLCDPLISSEEQWDKLSEAAIDLRNRCRADHIEVRSLAYLGLKQDERFTENSFYKHHYIALTEEPERLKRNFHRTCVRQRISRALKSDLYLKIVSHDDDLRRFYHLYVITRKRKALPPQPYIFLNNLWNTFFPSNQITLLLVEHEGQAVGGMILFKYKDRVSVEFAVSDENFRHISPNHFLFWEAINLSYRQGYKVFDFGRTSPLNRSLMDFKNRWGTKVVDLPDYYYPKERCPRFESKENSLNYKVMQALCKHAPLRVLPGIGKFCYRHLG